MDYSVVLPVYNERDNLREVYNEIRGVLVSQFGQWEVVFVDDGLADKSHEVLSELREVDSEVCAIKLATNFGQSAALYHVTRVLDDPKTAEFNSKRGSIFQTGKINK